MNPKDHSSSPYSRELILFFVSTTVSLAGANDALGCILASRPKPSREFGVVFLRGS
jgi:hypothetical protein